MQDQTIGDFLETLAARVPAPGGGAAAALHAAQAAALLGMVARYTTGEKYAEHAGQIEGLIEASDGWRTQALEFADADAKAFAAVADAYKMPKDSEAAKAARSSAIAEALVGAARPPAEVVLLAATLTKACRQLLPIGNRNVITDVAAAAEATRAAATTARVNIEVNLTGITDPQMREQLEDICGNVDAIVAHTEAITAAVREEIAK
jgi:formiminotetrahydrofolate cyclodeaminase